MIEKIRRLAIVLSVPAAAVGACLGWSRFDFPPAMDVCFSASQPYYLRALGNDCERWARDAMANVTKAGGAFARDSNGGRIYNNNGLSREVFATISDEWVSDYGKSTLKYSFFVALFWLKILVAAGAAVGVIWGLAFCGSWVASG